MHLSVTQNETGGRALGTVPKQPSRRIGVIGQGGESEGWWRGGARRARA